ncbi:MAG: CoA transferase [Acidimicrobiales bacterium]
MLKGLRVVELAELIAGPYCAKLLGDLGADIVKVEPPEGDAARRLGPFVDGTPGEDRSIPFLHLNTSKRAVTLDTTTPRGAALLRSLLADAELLITDRVPSQMAACGIGIDDLLEAQPSLVVLALTPYGMTGPYRDYRAYPLNTFHAAGEGYITPVASHLMPRVTDRPPLRHGRFAGEYKLATYAGMLALAAVYHARATGVGQVIDLSKQEALIGLNYVEFQPWLTGALPVATRDSRAVAFGGIMQCSDGEVQFTFHEQHHWDSLVKLMGSPAWADEEWAATHASRLQHGEQINVHLKEWMRHQSRNDIVREGQLIGCTVAPYNTIDEVYASEQMEVRQFFQPVTHPVAGTHDYPTAAYRFDDAVIHPGPAPSLGHDNDRVFGEQLGLSAEERRELRAQGII